VRLALASGLILWLGTTLVLGRLRWCRRPDLVQRLGPYAPGGTDARSRPASLSLDSLRAVVGPLAIRAGERLSAAFGVSESLASRLERIHSPVDATACRTRQAAWMLVAFGAGAVVTLVAAPPPLVGVGILVGAPLLAFLVVERRVLAAAEAWQRALVVELPVVAEQLAMLLAAGFSLGAALNRLAARGQGCAARDLARVGRRIRHGLSESAALAEWAHVARVEPVDRLVAVLALNREASDLGRMVSEEARAIRREAHRDLVRLAERRAQQVWIPVTVAALVPGVVFLAVPFLHAVRRFAGS